MDWGTELAKYYTVDPVSTRPLAATSAEANTEESEVPESPPVAERPVAASPASPERADLGVTVPEDVPVHSSEGHAEHHPREHSAETTGEESEDFFAPDFEGFIDEAGRRTRNV